jgi:radical SAM protein with 4Fe4S-binding SPASM domain
MMFRTLSIETKSYCNRQCASCLRQTEPEVNGDRGADIAMPGDMVVSVMDQAKAMGFRGTVSLSYYNEPLFDGRIHKFGRYAKRARFRKVQLCTNGDMLDKKMAKRLDGYFDEIRVALYDDREEEVMEHLHSLFSETRLHFTSGLHRWTHYAKEAEQQILHSIDKPCYNVRNNMIVAYNGDVLACCDEIVPHFDLGNVYDMPLKEIWKKKLGLIEKLLQPGGRRDYPYCMACPRNRRARARYKVVPA